MNRFLTLLAGKANITNLRRDRLSSHDLPRTILLHPAYVHVGSTTQHPANAYR